MYFQVASASEQKKEKNKRKRKEKRTPTFISQDIYGCPFFLILFSSVLFFLLFPVGGAFLLGASIFGAYWYVRHH